MFMMHGEDFNLGLYQLMHLCITERHAEESIK